jgi:hypothetical protein
MNLRGSWPTLWAEGQFIEITAAQVAANENLQRHFIFTSCIMHEVKTTRRERGIVDSE